MENKRKIIRIMNLLIIFLIILFFLLNKVSVAAALLIIFLFGNTVRLILKKSSGMELFNQRTYLFSFVMILFFGILGLRLAQVQLMKYEKFTALAKQQSYGKYYLNGKRGKILDSTGRELAYDVDIYKVIIDPKRFYVLEEKDKIVEELKKVKPFTVKNFKTKLRDNYSKNKRYIKVINKVDEVEKNKIDEILSRYKIKSNEIYFEHSTQRKYFSYHELAPIIGFMGAFSGEEKRRLGTYGIERYYDKYLKRNKIEKNGYYTNFRNLLLPSDRKNNDFLEKDGNNVQLTIDYYIQYILDDEMQKQFEKVTPKSAVGIMMDPSSGKILAMSSYPRATNIAYLNNRAIRSQYEMGSIFKPIIMAAAYEEGVINDSTRFDNPDGYIMRYGHKIRDSDSHGIGQISPQTIMRVSSNVGMSLISEKLDSLTFERYLKKFNLYDKTGIDTFGELAPRQLPYKKWDGMKKYTMSYGQGIAITPLQMISALAATVNGGIYYEPYLVDNIKSPEGVTIKKNIPNPERRVISKETSKKIREMLKETVENGTGKNGAILGYSIGGKTGTAQISGRGGYLKQEYMSSFMGIFPAENPKYIMLIMFEKPVAENYWRKFGAWVAAPVFRNTLDRILKYKGITPENVDVLEGGDYINTLSENVDLDLLPDFKGNGVRLALMIANKYKIEIAIDGKGRVVEQSPKPGTKIEDIKKIKIKLR
ncbi:MULTISPECIES: penicillin-binding transpeptidase domain-containing protein [Psychrilyobacter]|uniref:PASTA domain-containing protein n=1 Tax=Psychrilyobacter piezotolerans TaxID=2293438 RepID=A0ABX9KKL0_9FUSO|nr:MULTISPECIES: penicillin-binding transpeptidase domain-containing protein [Psychrilyobacter]MCS5421407.1 penicillin-binding transpeptidase domain-containing protein [Psychrilyobacter sp. S5]NDI76611.1 PASTA domain-containing protein [Psychrilyobacter piezotolerans]RDE65240.1 PASTA domain-containing protein [Psychrilyobacter sp. S5]REI42858.1 PASTA domain-containing protein [Psychrilyobacter piezotolerans]